MEDTLQTAIDYLQKLAGLPAAALTVGVCVVVGYVLRFIQKFPNEAIPVVVILLGGVFYPLIADANNDWPLRVWIVRNAGIGLVFGLIAWLFHNQVLARIESKLPAIARMLEVETPPEAPPPTTP